MCQGFIQALLLTPVLETKIQFLLRTNVVLGAKREILQAIRPEF